MTAKVIDAREFFDRRCRRSGADPVLVRRTMRVHAEARAHLSTVRLDRVVLWNLIVVAAALDLSFGEVLDAHCPPEQWHP
jgi:hypothetical protein